MDTRTTLTHENAKEILAPFFALNDNGPGAIEGQRFEFLLDDNSMSCKVYVKDEVIWDFSCRFDPKENLAQHYKDHTIAKTINKLYANVIQSAVIHTPKEAK